MLRRGTVYTETIVHAAPAAFADEAPYQVVIVELKDGGKVTARFIADRPGEWAVIGDALIETEACHEAPAFRKA